MIKEKKQPRNMRHLLWAVALSLSHILFTGCNESEEPRVETQESGMAELRIFTGDGAIHTRAAFAEGTPVKITAYARQTDTPGTEAFAHPAAIYTAEGITLAGAQDGLSPVQITSSNGKETSRLLVKSGYTYDVVLVVNNSPVKSYTQPDGTRKPFFGTLSGTTLTGFSHGQDILAARTTTTVAKDNELQTLDVTFTGDGSEGCPDANGNLPHLGSAVQIKAKVASTLLTALGREQLTLGTTGIDFNHCLPQSANLTLSGGQTSGKMEFAVQTGGYNKSYSLEAETGTPLIITRENIATAVATSGLGYLLPCPLNKAMPGSSADTHLMNLVFNLTLDGGGVTLTANNLELPPFKPGYRYAFVATFGKDIQGNNNGSIALQLEIEPWNSLSWNTTEGGYNSTTDRVVIIIGSWTGVTYDIVEGGYGNPDEDKLQIKVPTFTNVNWNTEEGGHK